MRRRTDTRSSDIATRITWDLVSYALAFARRPIISVVRDVGLAFCMPETTGFGNIAELCPKSQLRAFGARY